MKKLVLLPLVALSMLAAAGPIEDEIVSRIHKVGEVCLMGEACASGQVVADTGGGEGRSKGGNQSVSPWGVNTKGKRTRNNKRTDNMRLQRRPMNRKRYPLLAK